MLKKLQKILLSVPMLSAVGFFAFYLAFGFLALPALVKWQAEKQTQAQLGHSLQVGAVRFNPLVLRAELDDLKLIDSNGKLMLGFKQLSVDFELRSLIDGAWTFSNLLLDAPYVHLEVDKSGKHNFNALLRKLSSGEPQKASGPLPSVVLGQFALKDGWVEFSDQALDDPLVTRIEPINIRVDHLSTLADNLAKYQISAKSIGDESFNLTGQIGLNPIAFKGQVSLQDLKIETLVRSFSRTIAIDKPQGTIALKADFDLAVNDHGGVSGLAQNIDFVLDSLSVHAQGQIQPLVSMKSATFENGSVDLGSHEVNFDALKLTNGSVSVAVDAQGRADWSKLARRAEPVQPEASKVPENTRWQLAVKNILLSDLALQFSDLAKASSASVAAFGADLSLLAHVGSEGAQLKLGRSKATFSKAQLEQGPDSLILPDLIIGADQVIVGSTKAGLKLSAIATHIAAENGFAAKLSDASLSLQTPRLEASRVELDTGKTNVDGRIEQPRLTASGFRMQAPGLTTQLGDVAFAGDEVSLQQGGGQLALGLKKVNATLAQLKLTQDTATASRGNTIEIASASLDGGSITVAKSNEQTRPVQLTGNGISASLSDVLLLNPADKKELVRVGGVLLAGGAVQIPERVVSAKKLTMSKGVAHTWLDKNGEFNLLSLFAAKPETTEKAAPPAPAPAMRISLALAQLDDFSIDFEDRRQTPPMAIALDAIHAAISDLDLGSTTPVQVDFRAKLASGGQAQANGTVRTDNGAANLKVELAGVALAPVQTYLSQFANLRLASGTASTAGRLQYAGTGKGASKLAYNGSVSVDEFLLEELAPKRPFLSWRSVASDDVKLTLEPNQLDIGELRVERPSGRLIIAKDQSVNWTDVLKKKAPDESLDKVKAANKSKNPEDPDEVTFPATIARVRISEGLLDFADLSLRPQFAARMHELKGVVNGLGTDANASAKVQLDARVDEFGSAKIRGEASLLRPEKLTDISLEFRNLEMTSLSPYVAKFAGYSIASGRLALDLQYKVRDGKLLGQNKVVLKQLELGAKVDSPDALDLPLELALAVLKDADGVIDIGLPVSGDLNDPQFDYGAVIGKAIGNLLGSIVTAPFRALAALFGAGEQQKLDVIDFEPGNAAIAPPEREKLAAVARALKQRPNLMLLVPPTYAVQQDTPVLKSILVRTDIVQRMGITLAPGEDPGPIDSANPRVSSAVEQAFVQRYAPEVLAALKTRALNAMPPPAATQPAGEKPIETLPPSFYQGLVDRLINEEPVPEILLAQLATLRAEAIVQDLVTAGGAPADRISLGEPINTSETRDEAVTLRLQLKVVK